MVRAATELTSISRVHIARGEGVHARNACRQALKFDPASLELRLLLAQIHARFPGAADRAASPMIVTEEADDGPVVELRTTPTLEPIGDDLAGAPIVRVGPSPVAANIDDLLASGASTTEGRITRDETEEETAELSPLGDDTAGLVDAPSEIRYRDEVTAPTGAEAALPDVESGTQPAINSDTPERPKRRTIGAAAVAAGDDVFEAWSGATGRLAASQPDLSPIRTAGAKTITPARPRSEGPAESHAEYLPVEQVAGPLPDPFESTLGEADSSAPSLPIATSRVPARHEPSDGGSTVGQLESGDFRRLDPTPAGGGDLSPRSVSSGFSSRIPTRKRFPQEAPAGRTIVGPAAAHFGFSDLPKNAFTDRLPNDLRQSPFERLLFVQYEDGAAVVETGRPLDALAIVQDGVLRVINGPLNGDATDLARVSDGFVIGPLEFLAERPPSVSLEAEGTVGMFELPRTALEDLIDSDPRYADALADLVREKLIRDLLERAPIFASLTQMSADSKATGDKLRSGVMVSYM